jgi:hypothetical protein
MRDTSRIRGSGLRCGTVHTTNDCVRLPVVIETAKNEKLEVSHWGAANDDGDDTESETSSTSESGEEEHE